MDRDNTAAAEETEEDRARLGCSVAESDTAARDPGRPVTCAKSVGRTPTVAFPMKPPPLTPTSRILGIIRLQG